jgi:hypothetical protein
LALAGVRLRKRCTTNAKTATIAARPTLRKIKMLLGIDGYGYRIHYLLLWPFLQTALARLDAC